MSRMTLGYDSSTIHPGCVTSGQKYVANVGLLLQGIFIRGRPVHRIPGDFDADFTWTLPLLSPRTMVANFGTCNAQWPLPSDINERC